MLQQQESGERTMENVADMDMVHRIIFFVVGIGHDCWTQATCSPCVDGAGQGLVGSRNDDSPVKQV